MESELQDIETTYQRNLKKLADYVSQLRKRVQRWRMPTYLKNYYYRLIQSWQAKQKAKLTKERDAAVQQVRQNYQKPANRRKQACLIGINYENSQYKLNGCVNDVYKLRQLLISQYGYNSADIRLVINQAASRDAILREFTRLVANAVEGDTICFTFSGHGFHTNDQNGDEKDGQDELIVSADMRAVRDDELKAILQKHLKAGVKLFTLFDNCHSGTILDLRYQYLKNAQPSLVVHDKCQETKGQVVCLSGCADNQVSMDAYLNNQYNGAMTWALVDLLSKEKGLSWGECVKKVREKLASRQFKQLPQLTSGVQFDIAKESVVL